MIIIITVVVAVVVVFYFISFFSFFFFYPFFSLQIRAVFLPLRFRQCINESRTRHVVTTITIDVVLKLLSTLNALRFGRNTDLYRLKKRSTSTDVMGAKFTIAMPRGVSSVCNIIIPFIPQWTFLIDFRQFKPAIYRTHILLEPISIKIFDNICWIFGVIIITRSINGKKVQSYINCLINT